MPELRWNPWQLVTGKNGTVGIVWVEFHAVVNVAAGLAAPVWFYRADVIPVCPSSRK
jgi:hypothetical protein